MVSDLATRRKQKMRLPTMHFDENTPKIVKFSNVENPKLLDVRSPKLKFDLHSFPDGTAELSMKPKDGENHNVECLYNGHQLAKSPFSLCKSPPSISHEFENYKIILDNIYDHNLLTINADTLDYSVSKKGQQILMNYKDIDKTRPHDVNICFKGQPVSGGVMRLVPQGLREKYEKGLFTDENDNLVPEKEPEEEFLYSHKANSADVVAHNLNRLDLNDKEYENEVEEDEGYTSLDESEEELSTPNVSNDRILIKSYDPDNEEKKSSMLSQQLNSRQQMNSNPQGRLIYSHDPNRQTLYPPPKYQHYGQY